MIKKFFKVLLFFPPIIGAVLVLQIIINQKKPPVRNPASELTQHVRIIKAAKTPLIPRITGYGIAQPANVWKAVAQVSGKVVFIHPEFKKGALLKAGTEVIRIAKDDYVLAVRQAKANIRSAKAKLQELRVSESNTKNSLKIEKTTLKISNRELARKKKLLRTRTVSQSTIDQETKANLTQHLKVQSLENALLLLPTQRQAQEEQIEVFKSQLETAKLNLSRISLKLPFDALVAEEKVEITQFVNVGQELGSADSLEKVEVNAQVAVSKFMGFTRALLGKNKIGGVTKDTLKKAVKAFNIQAVVHSNAGEKQISWKASLERISDNIDPKTRTLGMLVTVEDSYRRAIPGYQPPLMKDSFVEVEIFAKTSRSAISIPRSALHGNEVYIADKENRLRFREVIPLLFQGNYVILKEGIEEGERIIISSMSPAIEGYLLKVTEDKMAAQELVLEVSSTGEAK